MSTARHMTRMPLCVGRQKGDKIEVHDLRPTAWRKEILARVQEYGRERYRQGRLAGSGPADDVVAQAERGTEAFARVVTTVMEALGEFGATDTEGAR